MREGKEGVHSQRRVEYVVMTTRGEGTGCWPVSESSVRSPAEARDAATEQPGPGRVRGGGSKGLEATELKSGVKSGASQAIVWACNVVGTVLAPRRWAKARTVALELDMEEKEAENSRVRGRQTRGPSLVVRIGPEAPR